jgi:hypothetical protein
LLIEYKAMIIAERCGETDDAHWRLDVLDSVVDELLTEMFR